MSETRDVIRVVIPMGHIGIDGTTTHSGGEIQALTRDRVNEYRARKDDAAYRTEHGLDPIGGVPVSPPGPDLQMQRRGLSGIRLSPSSKPWTEENRHAADRVPAAPEGDSSGATAASAVIPASCLAREASRYPTRPPVRPPNDAVSWRERHAPPARALLLGVTALVLSILVGAALWHAGWMRTGGLVLGLGISAFFTGGLWEACRMGDGLDDDTEAGQ